MNSRLKPVKTIDDKIRNHKNYKFIKVSYEDIMALFNEKVEIRDNGIAVVTGITGKTQTIKLLKVKE